MILTLEGLKGSGKTLVEKLISEKFEPSKFPKFTKSSIHTISPVKFVEDFKHTNKWKFTNIESSLGLSYYTSFFSDLERINRDQLTIVNRGILSLAYSGYYGYINNNEKITFGDYLELADDIYKIALHTYLPYEEDTTFIILECNKNLLSERLKSREKRIHSDIFFLEHLNTYLSLKERYEKITEKTLKKSRFHRFRNETSEDLGRIVNQLSKILS